MQTESRNELSHHLHVHSRNMYMYVIPRYRYRTAGTTVLLIVDLDLVPVVRDLGSWHRASDRLPVECGGTGVLRRHDGQQQLQLRGRDGRWAGAGPSVLPCARTVGAQRSMANRYRLESLQRLSTQLSAEIASPTPQSPAAADSPSASAQSRSTTSMASPYASPRAFYTPRLTERSSATVSSSLDLPPATSSPRPLSSSNGGSVAADARLARLEEQQAATAKRIEDVEKFYRDKLQSMQQTVTDALFKCQSQIDMQQEHFAGLVTKLERKVHEVDDDHTKRALDNHTFLTSSVADLRQHLADEIDKMTATCSDLEARTKAGFEKAEQELGNSSHAISQRIDGEVSQLNDTMAGMNDKWVDICIGLDNKAVRLDDAQTERAQASESQLTARLSELATELEQSCTQLQATTDKKLAKSADTTDEKLDRMTRQIESTNRALARAQEEAQSSLEHSTTEISIKLGTVAEELSQRVGVTKADLQAYVDSGLSEALTKTEFKTAKMLTDMRVQDAEDAVQEVHSALQTIEGDMEQCLETCSDLTTDLMLVETALEATAP